MRFLWESDGIPQDTTDDMLLKMHLALQTYTLLFGQLPYYKSRPRKTRIFECFFNAHN